MYIFIDDIYLIRFCSGTIRHMCTLSLFLSGCQQINSTDFEGDTPLKYSIKQRDVDTVHVLLEHRANANFTDTLTWGDYPWFGVCNEELTIAKLHIMHGVMVDLKDDEECLERWWELLFNANDRDGNVGRCADLLKLMITENAVKIPKDVDTGLSFIQGRFSIPCVCNEQ